MKVKTIICSRITSAVKSNSGDCISYSYNKINYLVKQNCIFSDATFHWTENRFKSKGMQRACLNFLQRPFSINIDVKTPVNIAIKRLLKTYPFSPKLSPQHLSEWMSNSLQERRVTAETKKWRSTQQMRHTGRGCWLMCTLCMTKLANILKIDQTLSN